MYYVERVYNNITSYPRYSAYFRYLYTYNVQQGDFSAFEYQKK